MSALDEAIAHQCQHPSGTMDDPLTAALCQCQDEFWSRRLVERDPLPDTFERRPETAAPGPLARLWLHLKAANLRWSIDSTEQYMAACQRDGILEGETLRSWRLQMQADRVELSLIEARLGHRPPPWGALLAAGTAGLALACAALLMLPVVRS